MNGEVNVRYLQGRAEAQGSGQTISVERRDASSGAGDACTCPLDLLTAALGS
jgi:hypothetical protein